MARILQTLMKISKLYRLLAAVAPDGTVSLAVVLLVASEGEEVLE